MAKIEIPVWFKIGMQFNSKWINYGNNTCIIKSFNESENTCEVEIVTPESTWIENDWNLQHTIWGFKDDYKRI